ncbi:hypothetical protein ACE7GA_19330 [Roseomonas sp. CCTCC AB2023176]|uniref:hypothetical protein n=1 Tax=Roseomonas sp. CCTCC AB2023176 TaxID=3342640 RepID=UPI0035D53A69
MRVFDFFALTILAVVPILWCRHRLPLLVRRDPPLTDQQAVTIGAVVAALLSGMYIYRYVVFR